MSPWLSDVLLRSQSDERLVALAREGREKAFTTLVERYNRPLLAFARSLGAGPRAEDVVQQALMQAWSSLLGGAEVEHVRGWLHQIVRNATWKSAARAPGSVELPEGLVGSVGPHEEVEDRIRVSAMVSEVNKLPDRQRTALVQTALEGRSRQEIAVGLGLSESAVRQLVHRGRSTVRAACTALTPGPALAWAAAPRHGPSMGERVAEALAGGGAAGLTGVLVKGGVVVAAAGALATSTIVAPDHPKSSHAGGAAVAPLVREVAEKGGPVAPRGASGGPAGARPAGTRPGAAQSHGRGRGNAAGRSRGGARHDAAGSGGRSASRQGADRVAADGNGSEHRGPGGDNGGGGDLSGRGSGGGDSHGGPGPSGSPATDSSHSGSGSPGGGDGSGSGSSGSGSGSSGSGSSGSGSGSGSSGPGSGGSLDTGSHDGLTRDRSGDGGLRIDGSGSHSGPG
jgi:RNA polymerase sigma factor (sigma-70 family)